MIERQTDAVEGAVTKTIRCATCGKEEERRGPTQRYCSPCRDARDAERQREWARRNPASMNPEQLQREYTERRARSEALAKFEATERRTSLGWSPRVPDLAWVARVAVPFTYAVSKNARWRIGKGGKRGGHIYMRQEATRASDGLILALKAVLTGKLVRQNKLWIDLLVEKPNHKGDAVNVVDTVCDALKKAITLDDRWYCLRSVDWQVVRHAPRLLISVGQEDVPDAQVCSVCGDIKPLTEFGKNRSNKSGHGRECRSCKSRLRPDAPPRVQLPLAGT